ncbi:hypothetical protein ABT085_25695, partial [Streptomyces sp. NPDC002265]
MRRLFPVTDETAAPAPDQAREAPAAGPAGAEREWSLDELAAAYAYPERTTATAPASGAGSATA